MRPRELQRWLEQGRGVQIVDARTRPEFLQGTIAGAAHAPLSHTPENLAPLNLDRSQPVVVLCLSGHRSRPGTRWLRSRGYEAYSLKGGIAAWRLAGFPLKKPAEEVDK